MVYVVMGVSGCGKSTIGQMLADTLELPFYDGDDFHPQSNTSKMASAQKLNDEDRQPWLEILAAEIKNWSKNQGAVLACSALKQKYRDTLTKHSDCIFIHLQGSKELILGRVQAREHFMPPALLKPQFDELQLPKDAITVNIDLSSGDIIDFICKEL